MISLVIYFGSDDWDAPLSLNVNLITPKELSNEEINEFLSNLREVITVVTRSKLKYPEGKGNVNMCLAIQQMREESEIKGAILMCKDLGISLTETIKRIAEIFQLSKSESCETIKQYW